MTRLALLVVAVIALAACTAQHQFFKEIDGKTYLCSQQENGFTGDEHGLHCELAVKP